ncbi:polysialyltransferase family glycosyltransferase [Pontibacter locisalis]|uniref:Polysialyltransferase family glycosyltransferase n=1 Tax=Pontibacter locisalis TaxID=1719035 RepID=A0ABW5IMJ8_9BACT
MYRKPKIIFVGDYGREDYVCLLKAAKDYCDFIFLFYTTPNEEENTFYQSFGKAIYWENYDSAQQLIEKVSPDKVVFLYIESYNHIVLNLACKAASTPTYLLEHGLRADYIFGFDPEISPGKEQSLKRRIRYYYQLARDFKSRIRSRQFLNNSLALLSADDRAFTKDFIEVRGRHNYLGTFRAIKSEKRFADYYIGFSTKIYEAYKGHEAAYFGGQVKLIGIPYFDRLANLPSASVTKSVLLIDQPLAEQGLLQWNEEHKKAFAAGLSGICKKHGYTLYIKPHPKQDIKIWQKLKQEQNCRIIDDAELAELAPSIPVVIGFYSTYLMPFAAFPHTTVLTYENHPAGEYLVSKPLVDAGVANAFFDLKELDRLLPNIEELHQKQLPQKVIFTKEWMFEFDGKAGERLRDILLGKKP